MHDGTASQEIDDMETSQVRAFWDNWFTTEDLPWYQKPFRGSFWTRYGTVFGAGATTDWWWPLVTSFIGGLVGGWFGG